MDDVYFLRPGVDESFDERRERMFQLGSQLMNRIQEDQQVPITQMVILAFDLLVIAGQKWMQQQDFDDRHLALREQVKLALKYWRDECHDPNDPFGDTLFTVPKEKM